MIDKSSVLVLIPALNEQVSVLKVLEELKRHSFHTLLISDGSTDGTALVGRNFGVRVLELPINLGVGGALRAGFAFAPLVGHHGVGIVPTVKMRRVPLGAVVPSNPAQGVGAPEIPMGVFVLHQ